MLEAPLIGVFAKATVRLRLDTRELFTQIELVLETSTFYEIAP